MLHDGRIGLIRLREVKGKAIGATNGIGLSGDNFGFRALKEW
jgi:hypothetical protein